MISLRLICRLVSLVLAPGAVCLCPIGLAPAVLASPLPLQVGAKLKAVKGSAVSTITDVVVVNEYTLAIRAEQVGKLTHFGKFTAQFSYTAVLSPAGFVITGTATLIDHKGYHLYVTANIVEIGTDYPYIVIGTLTVNGGTGPYSGAAGLIRVSGQDNASPEDTLELDGTLVTFH